MIEKLHFFNRKMLFNKKLLINSLLFVALNIFLVLVPTFFRNQYLAGPIVNMFLIIGVSLLGFKYAVFLCIIPSVVAWSVGILPSFMGLVIPFIMISNVIYIFVYHYLRNKIKFLSILLASFSKFIFLFLCVSLVFDKLFNPVQFAKVSNILSYSQLITALIGGLLAYIFLSMIKNYGYNSKN